MGCRAALGASANGRAAFPRETLTTKAPAVVMSPDCGNVIRLLMITLAEHKRSEVTLGRRSRIGGRLTVLPSKIHFSRIRRESVLVRSVSLVEAFTYDQLRHRLERHAP